jgi:hypothetical protein
MDTVKIPSIHAVVLVGLSLSLCDCHEKPALDRTSLQQIPVESIGETRGPDPRSAFENSGFLGGMTAVIESPIPLTAAAGRPEAGVSLALGGALSTAAIALQAESPSETKDLNHELALSSGARAALPGPALAMASSGDRIVVSCADYGSAAGGALIGFRVEGEGEKLLQSWKSEGLPARRLFAVPGGRIAVSDDAGGGASRVYLVDAASGAEVWGVALMSAVADIAYAPGLVLAAAGSKLEALDESTGARVWSSALTARARSLSAGNGLALVLAETGSLSAFSLVDGKGVGAAPGPFDPSLRPVADGERAIVAMPGGGAQEIEVKSGTTLRSWAWSGPSAFIAADRDRVYAGIDGRDGRGILLAPRSGDRSEKVISLASGAFDIPVAVGGSRGGLLLLLMDGSLVLVGKDRGPVASASALDAALSPPGQTALAIAAALRRFKSAGGTEPRLYLRFDLFVQGAPADTAVDFTAFRYGPSSSSKRTFSATPGSNGEVVAIFDGSGTELATNIDAIGASARATARFEKGKLYWIVAGWTDQAEPEPFRLFVK